jgi:hypothetical protein
MNDERLKLKVEKAAAEIAAMKLASGVKKGKGKKGKEDNETAVIDVTVAEEVPVDLEPLPLPRCELQLVFYTLFSSREIELGLAFHRRSMQLTRPLPPPVTHA